MGTLGDLLYGGLAKPPVSEKAWGELVHSIAGGDQRALHMLYETDASSRVHIGRADHQQPGNGRGGDAGRLSRRVAASLIVRCGWRIRRGMDHESGAVESH